MPRTETETGKETETDTDTDRHPTKCPERQTDGTSVYLGDRVEDGGDAEEWQPRVSHVAQPLQRVAESNQYLFDSLYSAPADAPAQRAVESNQYLFSLLLRTEIHSTPHQRVSDCRGEALAGKHRQDRESEITQKARHAADAPAQRAVESNQYLFSLLFRTEIHSTPHLPMPRHSSSDLSPRDPVWHH